MTGIRSSRSVRHLNATLVGGAAYLATIATAASRSAVPVASVIFAATTRPLRFSITTCPMWHSLAATRHPGYAISVRVRKRIEEVFGWIKTVGGLRKTRHRGTGWMFTLASAAYNLVRISKLLAAAA